VLVRYVNAALTPRLIECLAPGGFLICEQHLDTSESVAGLANPAFRVPPGSLLQSATGLSIDFFRESLIQDPDGRTVALAQIVAHRPR
jgi:tellurite methyltransferase